MTNTDPLSEVGIRAPEQADVEALVMLPLLGTECSARVVGLVDQRRWQVEASIVPIGWQGLLHSSFLQADSIGRNCELWVFDVDASKKIIRFRDDCFGRFPPRQKAIGSYISALKYLVSAIDDDSVRSAPPHAFSEVADLFRQTAKRSSQDWYFLWEALGRPERESGLLIAGVLVSVMRAMTERKMPGEKVQVHFKKFTDLNLRPRLIHALQYLREPTKTVKLGNSPDDAPSDSFQKMGSGQPSITTPSSPEANSAIEDTISPLVSTRPSSRQDKALGNCSNSVNSPLRNFQRKCKSGALLRALRVAQKFNLDRADLMPIIEGSVKQMIEGQRVNELLTAIRKFSLNVSVSSIELLRNLAQYDHEHMLVQAFHFGIYYGLEREIEEAIARLRSQGKSSWADLYEKRFARLANKSVEDQDKSLNHSATETGPSQTSQDLCSEVTQSFATSPEAVLISESNPLRTPLTEFIQHRLHPSLAKWIPGATAESANLLNLAILSCPLLLIADSAALRAYQLAVGSDDARLVVIPCSPTWLEFQDLWVDGLEAAWVAAVSEPTRLMMVLLEDLNHSLAHLWIRPLLNLKAGLTESLVSGKTAVWPDNLRVFIRLNEDHCGVNLPVPQDVFKAAGAVQIYRNPQDTVIPENQPTAVHNWTEWANCVATSGNELEPSSDCPSMFTGLAPYHICAQRDYIRVQKLAEKLGESPLSCDHIARLIRVDWPAEYSRRATTKVFDPSMPS